MRRTAPCVFLMATATQADDAAAVKAFSAAFADPCTSALNGSGSLVEPPQSFKATAPSTCGDPIAMTLWQVRCDIAAYNGQKGFLGCDQMNGTQFVCLAPPDLKIVLLYPANPESLPKAVTLAGWFASPFAINPPFDPAKGGLVTQGLWRGIGTALDAGGWRMVDGHVSLIRLDGDARYDAQVNPNPLYLAK